MEKDHPYTHPVEGELLERDDSPAIPVPLDDVNVRVLNPGLSPVAVLNSLPGEPALHHVPHRLQGLGQDRPEEECSHAAAIGCCHYEGKGEPRPGKNPVSRNNFSMKM